MSHDELWFGSDWFVPQPDNARHGEIVAFCFDSSALHQSECVRETGFHIVGALPDDMPPVLIIDLTSTVTSPRYGVFDLFEILHAAVDTRLAHEDSNFHDGRLDDDTCDALVDSIDIARYVVSAPENRLVSMSAGTGSVDTFAWTLLFDKAPGIFRALCRRLMHDYSFVLIDSPTMRSPAYPVCAALLPSALVVEAVEDNGRVAAGLRRAIHYRYGSSDLRPLKIYPTKWQSSSNVPAGDSRLDLVALDAAILADAPVLVETFHTGMQMYHATAISPERLLPWLATCAAPWQSPIDVLSQRQADALLHLAGEGRAFADLADWRRWYAGISERAASFEQPSIARMSAVAPESQLALDLVKIAIRTLAGDLSGATELLIRLKPSVSKCSLAIAQFQNLVQLATAWLEDQTQDELQSPEGFAWFDALGKLVGAASLPKAQTQVWETLETRYEHVTAPRSPVVETDVLRALPGVRAMILRMTRDVNLTNDLTQDVMIAMVVAVREGRVRRPEVLAGYVHETARHIVYAANRKMRPVTMETLPERESVWADAPRTPVELVEEEEMRRLVFEVLDELPSHRDRELIRGFYFLGLSKDELCKHLALSPEQFRKVLYRAQTRMRDRLRERLNSVQRMATPPLARARLAWQFADSMHAITYTPSSGRTYAADTRHGRILVRDDQPSYFASPVVLERLSQGDIVLPALEPTDGYPSPDEIERPNFELAWFSGRAETVELAPWVDRAASYRLWRTLDLGAAQNTETQDLSALFLSQSTSVRTIMQTRRWAANSIARFVNAGSMIGALISASAVEASPLHLNDPEASTRIDELVRSLG